MPLPSKNQFKKYTKPSKASILGYYLAIFGIFLTIMIFCIQTCQNSKNLTKVDIDKIIDQTKKDVLISQPTLKHHLEKLTIKRSDRINYLIKDIERLNSDLNSKLGKITIPLKFICIRKGKTIELENKIKKQVEIVNQEFNKHKIYFEHIGTSYLQVKMAPSKISFEEMNQIITDGHHELENYLNVYLAEVDIGGSLGYSTIPIPTKHTKQFNFNLGNWIVLEYDVLPEGKYKVFNMGKQLITYIGHWLGLYKTFHSGCEENGDWVDDTPAHEKPTYGPDVIKGCNQIDYIPIHNYMNYSVDSLLTEFSNGQILRMKTCLVLLRNQYLSDIQIENIRMNNDQ